jgi:hypothetical protein
VPGSDELQTRADHQAELGERIDELRERRNKIQ